jgi:pyruvate-formate lyase-activating enzyme
MGRVMRILLLNPPFFRFQGLEQNYPPLGLLSVGNKLQNLGYEVYIKNLEMGDNLSYKGYSERTNNYDLYLDALYEDDNIVWKELKQVIEEIKPNKIGISILNVKFKSAVKMIHIIHEMGIPIFVGGLHPTMFPEKYPEDVFVTKGEFLSNIEGKLDYSILMDQYSSEGYGHLITSMGCPFKCRFCASSVIWDKGVKFIEIEKIINTMTYLYDNFKPSHFTLWDETFLLDKHRIELFCKSYTLPVKWRCDTRADSITDDLIKKIKDVGCEQISIGIESGNNDILKYIGKNETIEDYRKAADILNNNDIQWKAYIIIGFPEETEENIFETIEFVKSLKPFRITLSIFTPYPGTKLFKECLERGLIKEDDDLSIYSHQSKFNYFTPLIDQLEFFRIRNIITKDIDLYNEKAIKIWR